MTACQWRYLIISELRLPADGFIPTEPWHRLGKQETPSRCEPLEGIHR